MEIEEQPVSSSVSLQFLLSANFYVLPLFLVSLVVGLALESSTGWFPWCCLALLAVSEPSRLGLGFTGNLKQYPQHLILSLCLACFPGFALSVGLLAVFTSLHAASKIGLSLIAIFSGLEIPIGWVALWRLQRAQSIRFKLSVK